MMHWAEKYPDEYPPEILDSLIWHMETGESFLAAPTPGNTSTHMVLSRYRIWDGPQDYLTTILSQELETA